MSYREKFLAAADLYCTRTGHKDSTLSNYMFKDGKSLKRIRAGGRMEMETYERAMEWLKKNTPPLLRKKEAASSAMKANWPRRARRPISDDSTNPAQFAEGRMLRVMRDSLEPRSTRLQRRGRRP